MNVSIASDLQFSFLLQKKMKKRSTSCPSTPKSPAAYPTTPQTKIANSSNEGWPPRSDEETCRLTSKPSCLPENPPSPHQNTTPTRRGRKREAWNAADNTNLRTRDGGPSTAPTANRSPRRRGVCTTTWRDSGESICVTLSKSSGCWFPKLAKKRGQLKWWFFVRRRSTADSWRTATTITWHT